jgi:hypothetical protein
VRITRDRTLLRLDAKIDLYDLLSDAAKKYSDTDWARFITSEDSSVAINIEGICCQQGDLYLGFKRPFQNGQSVVLKIKDIDAVFSKNILDRQSVQLWQTFDLRDRNSGTLTGISDLYLHNNGLYILSYGEITEDGATKDTGNLWHYDLRAGKLTCLKTLADAKPEGLTFNPDTNEFVIVCDNDGKKPSQIIKLKDL